MLSIVGDIRKNLFYYNSIQKITRKSDLLHFERLSHVNVFEIKKIPKAEIEEYLITYRDRIMNSPRNVINKNKLNKNSDFSKTTLKIVNSILIKNNLKIGIGRYGKGTLQVYKNDELIELRFNLNENPYSNEPKGIAEYIKSKYGD